MTMLDLDDIRPGTLEDGRTGSLMLPVGDYSSDFIVAEGGRGELFGVFLSGEHRFEIVMASKDGENWSGLFVDDVRIEVDVAFATDAVHRRPPVGSVVRRKTGTFLVVLAGERPGPRRRVELILKPGTTETDDRAGVAFTRWRIVNGDGPSKAVLREIEAVPEA